MSVKIFSKEENKWIIFPGTIGAPGKDAYIIAQENGYQGTKEEYYNSLTVIPTVTNKIEEIEDTIKNQVSADNDFLTEDRVVVSDGNNRKIKDSGILIGNLALKSYVDEKQVSWDKITEKPDSYTPSQHTHTISDITNFPEIPDPIQVDSELSSTSENPVQNKVINTALENKVNNTTLDNYYNKEEIDDKIASAGGGDVVTSGSLVTNNIIIGSGSKSIKDSGTNLESVATKDWVSEQNYVQNTTGEYLGNAASASKVKNKLIFTGASNSEYDGSTEVTINIPESEQNEIPIALPNPYPLIIEATAIIPNGNVSETICKYSGESTVQATINVTGYDNGEYEIGKPYLLRINGKEDYILNGSGKWGYPYLSFTTTPGNYGICDKTAETSEVTVSDTNLSRDKQTAIIVVKGNISVSFSNSKFKLGSSTSSTGTSEQYKCYCLQYINDNVILVNCTIYS